MPRSDQQGSRPGVAGKWPLVVQNVSGEEIPGFALLRVTGTSEADLTRPIAYQVAKPTGESTDQLLVGGPVPIPTGGAGRATWLFPTLVAFEPSDGTPATGANWGAVSGSWKLRLNGSGFVVIGGASAGIAIAKWVGAIRVNTVAIIATIPAATWNATTNQLTPNEVTSPYWHPTESDATKDQIISTVTTTYQTRFKHEVTVTSGKFKIGEIVNGRLMSVDCDEQDLPTAF